jgi:HIV Tat-specific factor 1
LTDWDSDGEPSTTRQTSSRFDKVVVLRNVFTLKQIKSEEDLIEELEEDMKEEGEEFGAVKNVTIFDQEEDGVVTVRFSDAAAAKAFRDKCDGRAFDGRTLKASIATGMEKFQKTRRTDKDKEEEEAKRLEEYSAFIEDRAKAGGGADT